MSHSRDILASSENPNWRTPQWLFDVLHAEFNFGVDMAADAYSAKVVPWIGPGSPVLEDALCGVDWIEIARGDYLRPGTAIFLNPPYSQKLKLPIEPWVERAPQAGEAVPVVAILPYATQTAWWREHVYGPLYRATEIRRFPYRLQFDPPPDYTGKKATGSNVNSAIVIWSPVSRYFVEPWVPAERYWDPRPKKGTA
jgi:phage N-6-adenine-methyltransferase